MNNKLFLKLVTLIIVLFFMSCNSTNKTTEETVKTKTEMEPKDMIAEGFVAGEISFSTKEGDCPITIKIEGKNGVYFYDPINITEEYKKEGEKVWFKFAGLRRMNRCDKASPINIIEIQKRN